MRVPSLLLTLAVLFQADASAADPARDIDWKNWSAETFEQARAAKKPVFLYLEAVWCHWCHVMQRETLARPEIRSKLAEEFIAVRVDHDSDPGLANRYRDYGWPALIFLSADGTDLAKRAGFIGPDRFARLLDAITRDPTPEPAAIANPPPAGSSQLAAADRDYLLKQHDASYDAKWGGLKTAQKFIDRDSVEYALEHADDPRERIKATQTLTAALALIDPVWGGASQYSTGGVWSNAHFEKIMRTQASYLRIYALAYARLGRASDLEAARAIQRYLFDFLRAPDGGFYVSQDADVVPGQHAEAYYRLDDAGRRKLGVPRVDQSLYADANGAAAEAFAVLHMASGDAEALDAARRAMGWVLTNREGVAGLMRHGVAPDPAPHLSDSLAVARAALALYEATAERRWLALAIRLGRAIDQTLRASPGGFLTEGAQPGLPMPRPDLAENIATTRFYNRLAHYAGDRRFRDAALHGMKFLSGHASRQNDLEEAGILLADEELARDPVHFTVVGAKSDAVARALFEAAGRTPGSYRRVEWWDRAEGALPNADVEYPDFTRAAGYVCTAGRCSRPSYNAADYAVQIVRLTSVQAQP